MTDLKCDFCSSPDVAWEYPAMSFVMEEIDGNPHGSLGSWAACAECAELIETENHHALAKRSLDTAGPWVTDLSYGDYEELLRGIKNVHNKFRANRVGEREVA